MNRINTIKRAVFNVQGFIDKESKKEVNKLIDSVIKSEYCTTPDNDKVKTLNFN